MIVGDGEGLKKGLNLQLGARKEVRLPQLGLLRAHGQDEAVVEIVEQE